MADGADVEEPSVEGADIDAPEGTLLTGEPRDPDKGEGDKEPDKGDGDKEPDKAEGDAPEGDEGEDDKGEGAPEQYADFEVAEGVSLNEAALESFKEKAKAANLPQATAQEFVNLAVEMQQKQADAFVQQVLDTRAGWLEASKTDSEFGGDALDANLAIAKQARDTYGSPELSKLLDETGLGNHPEMIRLLFKAGKALGEDKAVNNGDPAAQTKSDAEVLYPKTEK